MGVINSQFTITKADAAVGSPTRSVGVINKFSMSQLSNDSSIYDLEERTAKFAENIIDFVRTIKQDAVNRRIIDQLVGASGSVGANYCEASEAESKKDFIHKIGIARKETGHWLRLLARANADKKEEIKKLWKESHELLLIFAKINRSSRINS